MVAVGQAPEQLEHENLGQEGVVGGGSASHLGDPGQGDKDWAGVRFPCPHRSPIYPEEYHPEGTAPMCRDERVLPPGSRGGPAGPEAHRVGTYALDSLTPKSSF